MSCTEEDDGFVVIASSSQRAPRRSELPRADAPVAEIPDLGAATAEVLWSNAYVSTVSDLAALPQRFPGIFTAMTARGDLPMLAKFIADAQQAVFESK